MNVYLTVDVEVWPVHTGGWPHIPLEAEQTCEREMAGYFTGDAPQGNCGLPYQLLTLGRHGLKATFFVDPLFSFPLGLQPLQRVVSMIEGAGQAVALHLHPEWLTDPRCRGLPAFRGPMISSYPVDEQVALIRLGWDRLCAAGAHPISAFRAGSWGADRSTLTALRDCGLKVDCSLNARMDHSFATYGRRSAIQDPVILDGMIELPASRLRDGMVQGGRAISFLGCSADEIAFFLRSCTEAGRRSAVLVLHSNEFANTDRIWQGRALVPRRTIMQRFERTCRLLAENRATLPACFVTAAMAAATASATEDFVPQSNIARTLRRQVGQVLSRWY